MRHPLFDLIAARIAKAEAYEDFDNLAGAGKPLVHQSDPKTAQNRGRRPEFAKQFPIVC